MAYAIHRPINCMDQFRVSDEDSSSEGSEGSSQDTSSIEYRTRSWSAPTPSQSKISRVVQAKPWVIEEAQPCKRSPLASNSHPTKYVHGCKPQLTFESSSLEIQLELKELYTKIVKFYRDLVALGAAFKKETTLIIKNGSVIDKKQIAHALEVFLTRDAKNISIISGLGHVDFLSPMPDTSGVEAIHTHFVYHCSLLESLLEIDEIADFKFSIESSEAKGKKLWISWMDGSSPQWMTANEALLRLPEELNENFHLCNRVFHTVQKLMSSHMPLSFTWNSGATEILKEWVQTLQNEKTRILPLITFAREERAKTFH